MQSSLPSTLSSEGVLNSLCFSGSRSSLVASSRGRRLDNQSRRSPHMSRVHSPQSVDLTDVPKPELRDNDIHNSTSSSSSSNRCECVVRDIIHGGRPDHDCDSESHGGHSHAVPESATRSGCSKTGERTSVDNGYGRVELRNATDNERRDIPRAVPSQPGSRVGKAGVSVGCSTSPSRLPDSSVVGRDKSSFSTDSPKDCLSTSNSLPAPVDSVSSRRSDGQTSPSATLLPENVFCTLSPSQVESALQLYVERGGIRSNEVPAMLQELPWCAKRTAPASLASGIVDRPTEGAHKERTRRLLDPEVWLGAVAAATTSALATAYNSTQATAAKQFAVTATISERTGCEEEGQRKTSRRASIVPPHHFSLHHSTPLPCERTAEKRYNFADLPNEVFAIASSAASAGDPLVSLGAAFGRGGSSSDASRMSSRRFPGHNGDMDNGTPNASYADCHHVFASHELIQGSAISNCASSLSPPAHSSSSHLGMFNQAATVQHHHGQPSLSSSQGDSTRPPQNSTAHGTPSPVQRSAESQRMFRESSAAFLRSPSPVPSEGGVGNASASRAAPMLVEAPTGTSGIRIIFQQCLLGVRKMASPTLTVRDWEALVEQLRHDGHHKLPPQPILDDVACTIERAIQCEGHPSGLTLSAFIRVIQTQLYEVQVVMASAPFLHSTAGDRLSARQADAPGFPSHLNYVSGLKNSATAAVQQLSLPSSRNSQRSSEAKQSSVSISSPWRVLPTWCVALAGLFPREMSAVCSLPMVFYLRSVGLIQSVLEAVAQRLQLELDSLPEGVTGVGSAADRGTQHLTQSAAARGSPPSPSAERSRGCGSMSTSLAMSGVAAGVHFPSSIPISEGGDDIRGCRGGAWKEQPLWGPASAPNCYRNTRHPTSATARSVSVPPGNGGGDGALVVASDSLVTTSGATQPNIDAALSLTRNTAEPHYLLQRPFDEISASVVARAKARRLMDTLRRHTIPINRYECFARVEQADEKSPSTLCFISEQELAATLCYDDGNAMDDDSDAMSEMVATLTYDPAAETVMSLGNSAVRGDCDVADADVDLDQVCTSSRPPIIPRVRAFDVLPTVIMSAKRVARRAGRQVSSNGSTVSSAARQGSSSTANPSTPVPCMFRMSGVFSTVLPRKQEKAMVSRLSKPMYDLAAMSSRWFSAGNTHTRSNAVGSTTTTTTAATTTANKGISTPESVPLDSRQSRNGANRSAAAQSSPAPLFKGYRPPGLYSMHRYSSSGTVSRSGSAVRSLGSSHLSRSRPCSTYKDDCCASSCAGNGHRPSSSAPPLSPGTGCFNVSTLHAADGRARCFPFEVPSVLAAAPLSAAAAAAAAVQVIDSGAPSTLTRSARATTAQLVPRQPAGHRASKRRASRHSSAAPPRTEMTRTLTLDGRVGSCASSVSAKQTPCDSRLRKSNLDSKGADQRYAESVLYPREIDRRSGPTAVGAAAGARSSGLHTPHKDSSVSLYERRLMHQLQLAYAQAHPHDNESHAKD